MLARDARACMHACMHGGQWTVWLVAEAAWLMLLCAQRAAARPFSIFTLVVRTTAGNKHQPVYHYTLLELVPA